MADFKVTTEDGNVIEADASQIESTKDGYGVVTPDNIPEGYYNKEGLKSRIQERVKNTAENAKKEALEDPEHQEAVLDKFNISLDEDRNPVGLEPTVDVDELRKKVRKKVSGEKDEVIEEYKSKLSKRNESVIESAILSATNGKFEDHWLESVDGEKPLIVEKWKDKFSVDDEGNPYLKNEEGEKAFTNDGDLIRPSDYFSNEDKFGKYYKDNRQRGSNFKKPGNPNGTPSGDVTEWDRKQKLSFIEEKRKKGEDGHAAYKELVNQSQKQKKKENE